MKVCKIKPERHARTCRSCINIQMQYDRVEDCSKCSLNQVKEGEILSYGSSFWSGDYAMVQVNGKIEKISLSRIYDVRDV